MSVGWSYWAVFVPGGADICSPARPDILESQREESERCPGPRHHLLRFGPDAVDHACCCNRHLRLSLCHHVLTSVGRERDGCGAHEQTGAVFGSLRTHTHSTTPLHFTPLHSSNIIWVRPHWSCMLAWWGPITVISDHANIVIEKWFIQSEYNSHILSYNQFFVGS